jgi:hypothetical protein
MGGEFGAAMVYLHEIADPRYKAVTGSLGYISLGVGVVIGILVVICVTSLISPGELRSVYFSQLIVFLGQTACKV